MIYPISTFAELDQAAKLILSDLRTRSNSSAHVVALSGDLGAGKTTFVQRLASILGITKQVTSPTYTIMQCFATADAQFHNLVHIDAYRIEEVDEMRVLGFDEYCKQKDTIICIEWPERIASLLPEDTLYLVFHDTSNEGRTLTVQ